MSAFFFFLSSKIYSQHAYDMQFSVSSRYEYHRTAFTTARMLRSHVFFCAVFRRQRYNCYIITRGTLFFHVRLLSSSWHFLFVSAAIDFCVCVRGCGSLLGHLQPKTLLMFENIVMRFFEFILINIEIELKINSMRF